MTYEEATARCWAEIDLDELCCNYARAKEIAHPAEVICVLKGNAYGLGAPAVCKVLMEHGAKTFAVASGDEAEELLDACPGAEVLILGFTGEAQSIRLIQKNAIFTLFSQKQAETLKNASKSAGKPVRVHVKAETGLRRLGFDGLHAADEIEALHQTGCFQMEGLFTHLALHNRESDMQQLSAFLTLHNTLAERNIHFSTVHALDSIGMVRYPEYRLDAVRTGAWLYGNTPNRYEHPENCRLTTAFRARIAQLHDAPAGGLIGYDDDHPLSRDSRIATVSAGYLDGVPRYNNTGEVTIRGRRCPVVGLVCMDQLMVDVTDLPEAAVGDEVTFFGGDIPLTEYAAWGKLNRNEALGRLGRRVTRVYKYQGKTFYHNDYRK